MTSKVVGGDAPGAEGAEGSGTSGASGASGTSGASERAEGAAGGAADSGAPTGAEGVNGAGGADGAKAVEGADSGEGVNGADGVLPAGTGSVSGSGTGAPAPAGRTRRPPSLTTDTARPEGGGRAAAGDAPAPARQWPLLTVLGLAVLGLLIVGTDLFAQSFRVGTMLVGLALLVGACLRRTLPSVGMLAVRSRFTDMVTYGVMGGLIVLLALMVQPDPWLKIPFLEDILHLTIT
ncbi:DUF3017 domain-containing protein [Streptomyces sp. NPDC014870]|uniref:DUF3017 domain-containing protein n=1 Tax=Streptomyces sp. NPDC014870 TaxID=3364925 RepID=UPI0037010A8E